MWQRLLCSRLLGRPVGLLHLSVSVTQVGYMALRMLSDCSRFIGALGGASVFLCRAYTSVHSTSEIAAPLVLCQHMSKDFQMRCCSARHAQQPVRASACSTGGAFAAAGRRREADGLLSGAISVGQATIVSFSPCEFAGPACSCTPDAWRPTPAAAFDRPAMRSGNLTVQI